MSSRVTIPGHAAVATVPGQERIVPRREARGIVRKRECRMRDIDDRQSEAVGGGREHDGAAVFGREMGLHDGFQIRRAATASRAAINRRRYPWCRDAEEICRPAAPSTSGEPACLAMSELIAICADLGFTRIKTQDAPRKIFRRDLSRRAAARSAPWCACGFHRTPPRWRRAANSLKIDALKNDLSAKESQRSARLSVSARSVRSHENPPSLSGARPK